MVRLERIANQLPDCQLTQLPCRFREELQLPDVAAAFEKNGMDGALAGALTDDNLRFALGMKDPVARDVVLRVLHTMQQPTGSQKAACNASVTMVKTMLLSRQPPRIQGSEGIRPPQQTLFSAGATSAKLNSKPSPSILDAFHGTDGSHLWWRWISKLHEGDNSELGDNSEIAKIVCADAVSHPRQWAEQKGRVAPWMGTEPRARAWQVLLDSVEVGPISKLAVPAIKDMPPPEPLSPTWGRIGERDRDCSARSPVEKEKATELPRRRFDLVTIFENERLMASGPANDVRQLFRSFDWNSSGCLGQVRRKYCACFATLAVLVDGSGFTGGEGVAHRRSCGCCCESSTGGSLHRRAPRRTRWSLSARTSTRGG